MLILEIQIFIETILSILLIIAISTAFYAFLNIKKIKNTQKIISNMKLEIKHIINDADNELHKIKIKTNIIKSSIKNINKNL